MDTDAKFGVEFCRHHEVDQLTIEAIIAKAISSARLVAHHEDLDVYIQHIHTLKEMSMSFVGV